MALRHEHPNRVLADIVRIFGEELDLDVVAAVRPR